MMFPLVRDLAAEGIPVRLTCGVLGFSAQAFYKWHVRPVSDRDWADAHTINAIVDVHADDPEFGYRFIADELDEVWLTDITEHPTIEGKVYVCSIKDLCSNRIVGYSIDERMTAKLAVSAL